MNKVMYSLIQNLYPERPRSVALTEELLDWADIIFYMQEVNLKRLRRDYGDKWDHKCKNITYCTQGLDEIKDPHFTATQGFAFSNISTCIYNIVNDLNL